MNYRPMDELNIYRSIDMNRFRHVLYPEIWHFKYTDRTNRLLKITDMIEYVYNKTLFSLTM